jgi:sugar diacid utilization regulator
VAVAEGGADLGALRRHAGTAGALTGGHEGRAVALVLGDLPALTAPVLGVGAPAGALAGVPAAHAQAVLALAVARAVPALGPVARFERLGAHGLLAPLAFPPGGGPPPAPPAALVTLAAAPDGPELLATLRAVLDAGEDVAGAAAHLHVHRSTLHRRLRRVEQLTGADLADGRTRLELHAGLVLRELRP